MNCKHCNSTEIEFVEGRKSHLKLKILLILIAFLSFCLIDAWEYFSVIVAVAILMFLIVAAYDKIMKDKTFTKCICRNCGKWWWLK